MSGFISTRASTIEPSVTLSLNARYNALKEAGEDVVGLAAGEPDFETPGVIKEAGIRAIREGKTRYTPGAGIRPLREAVVLMASGGIPNKNLSPLVQDKKLSDAEIDAIVAFLGALDCGTKLDEPKLP